VAADRVVAADRAAVGRVVEGPAVALVQTRAPVIQGN